MKTRLQLFTVIVILLQKFGNISNQGILPDNRCYLENGASSESFFVSEDLAIGSTIGQVRVHGDPRQGATGSIALHLQEADSPVAISPGTKNLTLRRKLDKEGVDGPSSVFINLICERLHTLDPGFVIPVNIRVTDANDNAPRFHNAPYLLNISEVTVVGTRVLQGVHATDADQQGPFSSVRYSVLAGPHADYFEFENELEGTLVLRRPLDFETLRSFDVKIRAEDHGEPAQSTDTVLTVHVTDADDQNPRFLDDRYSAPLPEPPNKGSLLSIQPRAIQAFDQDLGINSPVFYTFNGLGTEYTHFRINRASGQVALAADLTDADVPVAATLVIRATQQDNPDRYALATLTVSRSSQRLAIDGAGGEGGLGRNVPIKFVTKTFNVPAAENLPAGAVLATLANNRPGESLRYFVSEQTLLKVFSINTRGELALKKKLDYEEKSDYVFKVFATDGITNDSAVVNVTVQDVNEWEPRFRYPHYEFFLGASSTSSSAPIGRIEAADGDKHDHLTLSLRGANASLFVISPQGELRLRAGGGGGGKVQTVVTLVAVATDSGRPPRSATVPITVHFPLKSSSVGITAKSSDEGTVILAGLGGILLVLAFVIAVLVTYICRAKRRSSTDTLPSLQPEKPRSTSPPHLTSASPPHLLISPYPPHSTAATALSPTTPTATKPNPMFAGVRAPLAALRSPTAVAMGGIPTSGSSDNVSGVIPPSVGGGVRLPSPKVHPAPQPPPLMWPVMDPVGGGSGRGKKLSWGDDNKTDSGSTEHLNNIDTTPKITENSNLTVYF